VFDRCTIEHIEHLGAHVCDPFVGREQLGLYVGRQHLCAFAAIASTAARPMPWPAAVTSACFPCNRIL